MNIKSHNILLKLVILVALVGTAHFTEARPKKSNKKHSRPKASRPRLPDTRYEKWEAIETPSLKPSQSFGGYAKGCIAGAKALPINGFNYSVVNLEENRVYGHPTMLSYIHRLSKYMHSKGSPMILIEDIGGPRGGPFRRGHASHQNGLDVDISFYMPRICLTLGQRQTRPEISFIDSHKNLKPIWGIDQTRLVIASVSSSQVERAFVSPVIKKFLCDKYPNAPWLYKVRAWWGHEDHIHVRLKCPAHDKHCEPQPLSAESVQCGADLNVWLNKVANLPPTPPPVPKSKSKHATRAFPKLPDQCEAVRLSK